MIDIATDPGVEHLLRIARAQCDASLAFAAIRDDAGKITVVTYPPTDDGSYWTIEGLRGIAQNTWDDPLLGRGGRAVLRISMPPKRLIPVPRQHSRLAVATLGSVVYPDLPWGLLCALEPVSGQFTDEHLDVLGNLAVRLNNYLRARQSVVGAEGGETTQKGAVETAAPADTVSGGAAGRRAATATKTRSERSASRAKYAAASGDRAPVEETKSRGRKGGDSAASTKGKAAAATAALPEVQELEDVADDPGRASGAGGAVDDLLLAEFGRSSDMDDAGDGDEVGEDEEFVDEWTEDDEEETESIEQEKAVIGSNDVGKSRKGGDVIVEIQRDPVMQETRAPSKASVGKAAGNGQDSLVLVGLNEFLAKVDDAIVDLREVGDMGAIILLNIAGTISAIGELEAAAVSSRLMAHTRHDDAVARVGSGTFGILLRLRRGVSDPATIRLRLEDWARQSLPAGPSAHNIRSCLIMVDPNEQPRPEDLFLRAVSQLGVL